MGDVLELPKKPCSKCRIAKYITLFAKDRSKPDGRRHICKSCDSRRHQQRYAEQGAEIREAQRLRYHTDPAYRSAKIVQARTYRADLRDSRDTSVEHRRPIDIGGVPQPLHPLRGVA